MHKLFLPISCLALIGFPTAGNAEASPSLTQVYSLTLTPAEMDLVWQGVGTLPYAQVAPLMAKIRSQAQVQNAIKPTEPPTKTDAAPPSQDRPPQ